MNPTLQQRKKMCGQSSGAGADLENAESASLRQLARGFLDRGGDRGQPMAGVKALAVKLIEQFSPGSGELNLNRFLFAAKDGTQLSASRSAKQRLDEMAGVF